ncbi:MAG TPA: type I restriction endonuclease subunit R [Candidatus Limnocylindrales bacterium]
MSGALETDFEIAVLEYFEQAGWQRAYGPEISPGGQAPERAAFDEVVLQGRLRNAVRTLNPALPTDAIEQAVRTALRPESGDLVRENYRWHTVLVEGVPVSYRDSAGELRHDRARLIDLHDHDSNDYLVVNQFRVVEPTGKRRADVVAFINGIPIGIFELKRPAEENATIKGAWNQLETYKKEIPTLLAPTAVSVIADGANAKVGAITTGFDRFARWRTIDEEEPVGDEVPQIKTIVLGVFDRSRILEIIEFFIDWGELRGVVRKRIAQYNQYWAVRAAHASVKGASGPDGDQRGGIVYHGQGSGKSMAMVLTANILMRDPDLASPTIVVITDRNDLDDQLWTNEFAPSRTLPERPVQAESRSNLRDLLNRQAGGIVLTTLQKFDRPEDATDAETVITARRNVVVLADEAHRSQYGLRHGLAADLRGALPGATFVGYTGTPIDERDRSTRAIFGDYISIYSPRQAVEDQAIVPIYYESRVAKVKLSEEAAAALDEAQKELTEELTEAEQRRVIRDWTRVEAILGSPVVIDRIVDDLLEHWEQRKAALKGKAMIVTMSRRIAAQVYDAIVNRKPDWHSDDDAKGRIKAVYTGGPADDEDIKRHVRSKEATAKVKDRAQDPEDELEMVVVCDLWLAGFDSPSLHTMYFAKLMRGHGLFQAITRPNRVYLDKPAGLIVSYVPISDAVREAVATFNAGDASSIAAAIENAEKGLREKHEVVSTILHGHTWDSASAPASHHHEQVQAAWAFLKKDPDKVQRFVDQTYSLIRLSVIAGGTATFARLRNDIDFFADVRGLLVKIDSEAPLHGERPVDLDSAMQSLVAGAIEAEEVVDIYTAAGMDKPEISLLSEEVLKSIAAKTKGTLGIELIRKLLADEIRSISRQNIVRGALFSEQLAATIRRYQNRALDDAEIMAELVLLAKHLTAEAERPKKTGLSKAELAFYDAVATNDSAVKGLGDDTLKAIARDLAMLIRRNATLDWRDKESVRAQMRVLIKTLLARYDYPPDKQPEATELVIKQAEQLAFDLVA